MLRVTLGSEEIMAFHENHCFFTPVQNDGAWNLQLEIPGGSPGVRTGVTPGVTRVKKTPISGVAARTRATLFFKAKQAVFFEEYALFRIFHFYKT